MGIMSTLLGGDSGGKSKDYVDISGIESSGPTRNSAQPMMKIAELYDRSDMVTIRDELYDGNFILVSVKCGSQSGYSASQFIDDMRGVVDEIGGDMAWRSPQQEQIIITPHGSDIDREKLVD